MILNYYNFQVTSREKVCRDHTLILICARRFHIFKTSKETKELIMPATKSSAELYLDPDYIQIAWYIYNDQENCAKNGARNGTSSQFE